MCGVCVCGRRKGGRKRARVLIFIKILGKDGLYSCKFEPLAKIVPLVISFRV